MGAVLDAELVLCRPGPTDAFLAEAAAAVGDLELARRHADDALALCETWQVPLVAQWLRDQRDRYAS